MRDERGGDASALKEVLTGMRREWRRAATERRGLSLPETLTGVLGAERAASVGFGGLTPRGVLTLTVDSDPLKAELEAFHAEALLAAVRATPEGARVRSLRFVREGGRGR